MTAEGQPQPERLAGGYERHDSARWAIGGQAGDVRVASYRKASVRERRAWSAAMRAARGNTAQPAEGEDAVSVAWWNARVLAAGGDAAARDKLEWLLAVLQERRPTVVFLFEVLGRLMPTKNIINPDLEKSFDSAFGDRCLVCQPCLSGRLRVAGCRRWSQAARSDPSSQPTAYTLVLFPRCSELQGFYGKMQRK